MTTKRHPRTLNEAFPKDPEYAESIYGFARSRIASNAVKFALAVGLIAVIAAISCTSALAQTSFVVHGLSYHSTPHTSGRAWNETNVGIGLRREFSADVSAQVGMYHNSNYRISSYASVDYTPLQVGRFSAGGFAALATGYKPAVIASGGALLRWQSDKASVAVRFIPRIASMKDDAPGLVSVELGWRFWS